MKKFSLKYYLSHHKLTLAIYFILYVLHCSGDALATILFANSLTNVTSGSIMVGAKLLVYALIVCVAKRGLFWITSHMWITMSNKICSEISLDLSKRCFDLSSATFSENVKASFVQKILREPADALDYFQMVTEILGAVISQLIVSVYIITLNAIIGVVYIIFLIAMTIFEIFRQNKWKHHKDKINKVSDATYSFVTEVVNSEKDIKALDLQEKLFETTDENLTKMRNTNNKGLVIDNHLWQLKNGIIDIAAIAILLLGIAFMQKDIMTLGTYILLFSYRNTLYDMVWYWGNLLKYINRIKISCKRMFELYDENKYPSDKFGDKDIKNVQGKIEFKNVSFAYAELEEKDNKKKKEIIRTKHDNIFNKLSFKIEPNTTVAFVGKSGSGKSTILSLMSKLYIVDSGTILVDGIAINDITKESLRSNISLINQFPYIFDMSVKDNLLLVKKDATDEELWQVLEKACFADDVRAFPKGLDTKVGESGVKLSGGQRQRLAIARALLKNSKIILFDESTSSLDNFAQGHIQESIENMKGQHTIVIVAHRLSTIRNADKIYFLDEGKIADSGTFEELFENNATFKQMFMMENLKN